MIIVTIRRSNHKTNNGHTGYAGANRPGNHSSTSPVSLTHQNRARHQHHDPTLSPQSRLLTTLQNRRLTVNRPNQYNTNTHHSSRSPSTRKSTRNTTSNLISTHRKIIPKSRRNPLATRHQPGRKRKVAKSQLQHHHHSLVRRTKSQRTNRTIRKPRRRRSPTSSIILQRNAIISVRIVTQVSQIHTIITRSRSPTIQSSSIRSSLVN